MKNLSHITVILDRSGSMEYIKQDIIEGFNNFLKFQKQTPAESTFTLIQFDSENPYEVVHNNKPLENVPELSEEIFIPRGSTPLFDCLGRSINDLSNHIKQLPDNLKPDKVFFVIITDGMENSSREYHRDDIIKLINEKKDQDKWEFIFLSADLLAVNDALSYGIDQSNVYSFEPDSYSVNKMWSALSLTMSEARINSDYKINFRKDKNKL
jgi:hypothetical protein